MKNKFSSILLFSFITLLSPYFVKAQDSRKDYEKASAFFNNNVYDQALPIFHALDSADPTNNNLNFQLGVCYLNAPIHQEKAIPYLVKAVGDISEKYSPSFKERHAPPDAWMDLGKAYHLNYQFDSAISCISKFLTLMDTAQDRKTAIDLKREIQMCQTGKELVAHPVKMLVKNLGPGVNSTGPDYSPVVTADESQIFFTSRREGPKDPATGLYYENIYMADNTNGTWGKATNIGMPINAESKCSATVGLSPDGQTIFIYKDDGNGDGNIYTTHLNGLVWSSPTKLDENVDSKFWEPSASVSADGQILYFSSNRPGGFGGLDIYMSRLLPNGQWGKATNLGPNINTAFDEDAPYIHPDGTTLYFSSRGHETMGGYDIFESLMDSSNHWGKPVNIGYPVNTPGDDIFFFPTTDGKGAYYSSFKDDGFGEKDIYRVTFPDKKGEAITVFRGRIISGVDSALPSGLEIVVTDNQTGDQIGIYHPNSASGKYLIILPCGKNYNVAYNVDDNLFHTEHLDVRDSTAYSVIERAVDLHPLAIGDKLTLKGMFYTSGSSQLSVEEKMELQKVYDFMMKHPEINVEVGGYSDASEDPAVSKERAEAGVKFLAGLGMDPKRLMAKGYGTSNAIAKNKNADGSWNKDGMKYNRRIGFKVVPNSDIIIIDQPIDVPKNLKPGSGDEGSQNNTPIAQNNQNNNTNQNANAANGSSAGFENILFETGKSIVHGKYLPELKKLCQMMREDNTITVVFDGHTDTQGNDAVNIPLAEARAISASMYLTRRGISSKRIKTEGFGASMPVAPNKNADGSPNKAGMSLNRRTEIKVTGAK